MNTGQSSQILNTLKMAGGMALGLGLLYAAFMTIRSYSMSAGAGPNWGLSFVVSLVSCAAPLFVVIFLVVGAVTILQDKDSAQS